MALALTLDDAKQYLRYDGDDQDATITTVLAAGQEWVERYTGLLLTKRQVRQVTRTFNDTALLFGPVDTGAAVTIDYLGGDGSAGTMGDAGVTVIDNFARASLRPAHGSAWPAADPAGGIIIAYTAGYATPEDVPAGLLHAMLLYAGMADEQRGGEISGAAWDALHALIAPYRAPGLA